LIKVLCDEPPKTPVPRNVSKARAADDLVNAIRTVPAGNTFFRSEN
jgi:hypothetical protein